MDRLDATKIVVPGLEVRVVRRCASTNLVLLEDPSERPVLLVAEEQSAGRGRRGRRWYSAPGAGLTFSLRRRMLRPARELGGLSLAAGVAVARALRALGASEIALKWPNDLLANGAKLGGILIETRVQDGATVAVIGVGVNCRAMPGLGSRLRRNVIALEQLLRPLPSRNLLAAPIAAELLEALEAFDERGLAALREEWEAMHAHAGQRIRVRLADGRVLAGFCAGVADDGALRLRTRAGLRSLHSGRVVSARPA